MTDRQRLDKLLRAEGFLKRTTAGYTPTGVWWRNGMPLLWEVRQDMGGSVDGLRLAQAHGLLKQTDHGYDPRASRWREAMGLIDGVEANLAKPPVPTLGPAVKGGKTLLLEAPTHNTDGLKRVTGSEYPAVDLGFLTGLPALAVEPLWVTRQSSSQGGDAFYATGDSGLKYWYGHLTGVPATGRRFKRGDVVGRIAAIPGADHLHIGVDARALLGHDLTWGKPVGRDYTFGGPTYGQQLARGLV
jgi:hypothetical protein